MYELATESIARIFLGDYEVITENRDEFSVEVEVHKMLYMTHKMIDSAILEFEIVENIENIPIFTNRTEKMMWFIRECYDKGMIEEYLKYYFNEKRFLSHNKMEKPLLSTKDIMKQIPLEIDLFLDEINSILYFDKLKLIKVSNGYRIINLSVGIEADHDINLHGVAEHVQDYIERMRENLNLGHYDTVLTHSRTILEELYIHILKEFGVEHKKNKGNIKALRRQASNQLNMIQKKEYANHINDLLNGLNKISDAIVEMRNSFSDSHGVGELKPIINKREARLIMNATITTCDYLLDVLEDSRKNNKNNHTVVRT